MQKIIKRPRPLKYAVISYNPVQPLVLYNNVKKKIAVGYLEQTLDDFTIKIDKIDLEAVFLLKNATLNFAGYVLGKHKETDTITKYQVQCIVVTPSLD